MWPFKRKETDKVKRSFVGGKLNYENASTSARVSHNRLIDEDIKEGLEWLRLRSRHEYQNNDFLRGAINTLTSKVIGDEIKIKPMRIAGNRIGHEQLSQSIVDAWHMWGKHCTTNNGPTFTDVTRMCIRMLMVDGEFFLRFHTDDNSVMLEVVDPNRIPVRQDRGGRTKDLGIEYDDQWNVTGYYVLDKSQVSSVDAIKSNARHMATLVPAEQILHVYQHEFPGQSRGYPATSASIYRLAMVRGYEEAEIVNARLSNMKVGFLEENQFGQAFTADVDDGVIEAENPGEIIRLPQGVSFKPWDPAHPASNFEMFMRYNQRAVSSGIGAQYHDASQDLASVNFSSLRQSNITFRDHCRMLQELLIDKLVRPVYERWLPSAITNGEIKGSMGRPLSVDPKQIKTEFIGRGWEHVQPREQATADQMSVQLGVKSRSEIIRERGLEPLDVFREIAEEKELFLQLGIDMAPAQDNMSNDNEEEDTDSAGSEVDQDES